MMYHHAMISFSFSTCGAKGLPDLLVGKAQLVLEDRLAVDQALDLVSEGVEGVDQRVGEAQLVHAQDGTG